MNALVKRTNIRFLPEPKRVIARFFFPGPESRVISIIQKVIDMPETAAQLALNQTLRDFSPRHRNVSKIYKKHCDRVGDILRDLKPTIDQLPDAKKYLIGAYFTSEYSIEAAAFFNPSMVEDPDQTGLDYGQKRVIVSFRATGEGHISSIVFRSGVIDRDNNLFFQSSGNLVDEAEMIRNNIYEKNSFTNKLTEMHIDKELVQKVMDKLGTHFDYNELSHAINAVIHETELGYGQEVGLQAISWLADSHYEISFSLDTAMSERVIFPIAAAESNGIEDARFVKFVDDEGKANYYATYTAYNGFTILPKLVETKDFYHFKVMPLHGEKSHNKGMALFPRKINGKFAMLGRIDGINNYIMLSDNINLWQEAHIIQEPRYPWEFIQVGNCGSPIETEHGWLVITHGVGPMRKYCLGATLLDLDDPTKVVGQLTEPLLSPNKEEREGYVPNVVYSCGSIVHNNQLIIPYAMSDTASTVATVPLDELLDRLIPTDRRIPKTSQTKSKAKILLVEDDVIQQKIVSSILKASNYDVEIAPDGIVALIQIAKGNFNLILSDINMPNFDGFQMLDYIKNNNISIPVVFLTGYLSDEIEKKGLKMGALEYIRKPVDRDLLLLRLEKILG